MIGIQGWIVASPLRCRVVTLGQVVMAFRVRDGGDKGAALASADERFQLGMVAVESCRRFALALGRPEQDANVEIGPVMPWQPVTLTS